MQNIMIIEIIHYSIDILLLLLKVAVDRDSFT